MLFNVLVLDIDGTLLDSVAIHRETLRRSIEVSSMPHKDYRWSSYQHRTDSGIFAESFQRNYGREPTDEECGAFERLFGEQFQQVCSVGLRPVPGARSLLTHARAAPGWRVVFATGSFRGPALYKLRELGLHEPLLVTASEHRSRQDIVATAIKLGWGTLPEEARGTAVSVGDGTWDAQAARDLGMPFFGIARVDVAEELRSLGAVTAQSDCEGLWPVIESFCSSALEPTVDCTNS